MNWNMKTTYCWGHFWYIFAFPYLDKQYCLKARNIIILKEALEQSTAHATQLPERIALQKVALQMYIKNLLILAPHFFVVYNV